jgi:hypothetical protein
LDVALQGTIDSFPIVDVLQLLASSGKTGRLDLVGDRGRAALWISDGELVAGTAQGRFGADPAQALWELLRYSDGSFEFVDDDLPATTGFDPAPVTQMIEQATRMQAEWEQIERRVPSLSHQVALAAQLPSGEVRLGADDWAVLVAAGPGPTVASLIAQAGLEEFEGCRRVAEMVDRGLLGVEVATVPAHSPSDPISGSPGVAPTSVEDPSGSPLEEAAGSTAADAFASAAGAPPVAAEPPTLAAQMGIEVAPDPMHPAGAPPGTHPTGEPVVASASFPEHFPIDDLVPAPDAAWEPSPPEPVGGGFVDPTTAIGGRAEQSSAPGSGHAPMPGNDVGHPAAQDPQQPFDTSGTRGFDSVPGVEPPLLAEAPSAAEPSLPAEPAQQAQPVAQVGPPPEEDVLAQIGRLSPKAAEAIAAALGDGAERGPAG